MKRVISGQNLPTKFPVYQTVTVLLLLDRLNIPQWAWGVTGTLAVFILAGCALEMKKERRVNIFEEGNTNGR